MGRGAAGYLKVNAEPSLPRAESAGPGAKGQNLQPWGQACWQGQLECDTHAAGASPHTVVSSHVVSASPGTHRPVLVLTGCHTRCFTSIG